MRLLAAYTVDPWLHVLGSVILVFAKAALSSDCLGTAICTPTGSKPPLGREEAVAGHPSGAAAALVLGRSFAASSP